VDAIPIPGHESHRRALQQLLALNGAPAYAVRALQVEAAFEDLLEHCRRRRAELLELVSIRLATLRALAGDWTVLRPWLADGQIGALAELHAELATQLRVPVSPTASLRILRRALVELAQSIVRFNRRWDEFLQGVDVSRVNALREGYNAYYVLEKECVLGSPRLARQGFRPLEPLMVGEISALFPPLPVPVPR
jgi:hypothetical protein